MAFVGEVRVAVYTDKERVLQLAKIAAPVLLPDGIEFNYDHCAELFDKSLLNPRRFFLVYRVDDVVQGFFLGEVNDGLGTLVAEELALWVQPEFRGGKVFDAFLNIYEMWAERKGAVTAMMPASSRMPRVGLLLQRKGYECATTHFMKAL